MLNISYMIDSSKYSPLVQYAYQLFMFGDISGKRIASIQKLAQITGLHENTISKHAKEDNWKGEALNIVEKTSLVALNNVSALARLPSKIKNYEEDIQELNETLDSLPNVPTAILEGNTKVLDDYLKIKQRIYDIEDRIAVLTGEKTALSAQDKMSQEYAKLKAKQEIEIERKKLDKEEDLNTIEIGENGIRVR